MVKLVKKISKSNTGKHLKIPEKSNPLDIYASSVANPENEIVRKEKSRNEIYELRKLAGKIVGGRQKDCGSKILKLNNHPTFDGNVTIMKTSEGKSYYSGLETCGSVWGCPVCSLKISTNRALEVKNTINNVISGGGNIYMATFTIPHYIFDRCDHTTNSVTTIWRKIKATRKYRKLKEQYKFIGDIRTLEITHGGNGWHPHLHILVGCNCSNEEMEEFLTNLFILWKEIAMKMKLGSCSLEAFKIAKVYDGDGASEYITKWSASSELVKGNQKLGKAGRTPFQILSDIVNGISQDIDKDKRLFQEYFNVFKGKRQLTWSKDFKKDYCDYDEKTDEEIAADEQGGVKVFSISKSVWYQINDHNLASHILNIYDLKGVGQIPIFLNSIGIICFHDKSKQLIYSNIEDLPLTSEFSDFL